MRNLCFILLAIVLVACATSPTGRRQLILVPNSQMNSMGVQAFQQLKEKTPRENDPRVNRYVKCIANAVVAEATDRTGVESWEVVVFKDDSANAFALPGGKIGVHTGMLKVAATADQLAAVLGHEVGHVIARHGAERVSQNVVAQGGLVAASVLTENSQSRDLILGSLAVGSQFGVLLPFSRKHESEADDIGQELMAKAGFDPRHAANLWRNMQKNHGSGPPEFMSTHPSSSTRIQALQRGEARTLPIYQQAQRTGKRPNCQR